MTTAAAMYSPAAWQEKMWFRLATVRAHERFNGDGDEELEEDEDESEGENIKKITKEGVFITVGRSLTWALPFG
jgi:hypothetical protein